MNRNIESLVVTPKASLHCAFYTGLSMLSVDFLVDEDIKERDCEKSIV